MYYICLFSEDKLIYTAEDLYSSGFEAFFKSVVTLIDLKCCKISLERSLITYNIMFLYCKELKAVRVIAVQNYCIYLHIIGFGRSCTALYKMGQEYISAIESNRDWQFELLVR